MQGIAEIVATDHARIGERKPLIHHITNFVVMNETANLTLCLGALPVMAHALQEVEEMIAAAGALVLNIGTLTPELIDTMIVAAGKANELGIPVVLDPVGAGATTLRTDSARRILDETKVSIVRGNCAEVSILAGLGGEIRGVESIGSDEGIIETAKAFSAKTGCVAAITGKEDVVSDGKRVAVIRNGDQMLATVTGTGCMSTTAVAGFAAVQGDMFMASVGGLVTFGIAGEQAADISGERPGTFHAALYDSLAAIEYNDIVEGCKAELV